MKKIDWQKLLKEEEHYLGGTQDAGLYIKYMPGCDVCHKTFKNKKIVICCDGPWGGTGICIDCIKIIINDFDREMNITNGEDEEDGENIEKYESWKKWVTEKIELYDEAGRLKKKNIIDLKKDAINQEKINIISPADLKPAIIVLEGRVEELQLEHENYIKRYPMVRGIDILQCIESYNMVLIFLREQAV